MKERKEGGKKKNETRNTDVDTESIVRGRDPFNTLFYFP